MNIFKMAGAAVRFGFYQSAVHDELIRLMQVEGDWPVEHIKLAHTRVKWVIKDSFEELAYRFGRDLSASYAASIAFHAYRKELLA